MNWIDKHQLDLFAETIAAKQKLPRLVSELILATSDIPDVLRFLADESGQVRGFDGALVSPGAPPFVPAGKSYWEFGCEKDVREKARKDLASRTASVDPAERAQATLVLVTPRHYDSPRQRRDDFVSKISAGSGWKDVRLIDGQELKHWLDMATGVAARWARRDFQSYPPGVWSVDEFWHDYSNRFDPPLREEVLLAGRDQQADAVVARMANLQPERITICADSPEEALAFAMAAMRRAKDEVRLLLVARSLVVTTPEAARDLRDKPLVYLPTEGAVRSVGSLANWGPTILAKGRRDADGNAISLRRPSSHDFATSLEQPRISRTRAAQLATECGRSVTVLSRRIPGILHPPPSWASQAAVPLLPALLAGAWDASNPHDRDVLAQLAGVADYAQWEALLQPLLMMDDPPIEYQKPVWKMRAPVDAFVILGSKLGRSDFDSLEQACTLVLRELDRNLEKSGTELMMAGPGVDHSDWLRDGLATTLLMISTLHDAAGFGPALALHGGPEQWVGGFVAGLPGLATDGRLLASLQRALPILAEAAPFPFVQALERFVSEAPDGVAWLFTERKDFIHTRAHHTSLLWALETIAWDPKLVSRVCLLLTRLAALDPNPGSKLINRPLRSLRGILLPWLPGTDADVTVRVRLLEAIRRTCEPVAWSLSLQLLPEYHAVGEPVVRPQLREAGRYDNGVTWADAAKVYAAAAKQALSLVGGDPDRWTALIDHLVVLSDQDQSQALRQFGEYLGECDAELRAKLWQHLNDLFLKHAQFGDADWALRGSRLNEIGEFVRRFTPQDRVQLALPLFDDMRITRRLAPDGKEVTEAELEDRRSQTVRDLLDQEGSTGILRLAEAVRNPWLIAQPLLALLANPDATLAFCSSCLERGSDNARMLARAMSAAAHRLFPDLWLECLSSNYIKGGCSDDLICLLLGLLDDPQTWAFVGSLGEDVTTAFWQARPPWDVQEHGLQARDFAAERYLSVGRPGHALATLADKGDVSPALTFQVLAQLLNVINSGEIEDGGMLQYRVEQLFTALRAHPEINRGELAKWEFAYLPLLTGPGQRSQPLGLFKIMSTDPTNFVEALKLMFRAKNAVPSDRSEGGEAKARAAYNLLEAFRTVPGVTGTGVDGAAMARWVRTALEALADSDRLDVGLSYIGKLFAHAPNDPGDSAWPAIALRDVIEAEMSEQLEQGIAIERFNMRGVYSKGIYDGGEEERRFASQYRDWAAACVAWPRTSAMLDDIATGWDRQAEHEDIQAQQRLMKD